MPLIFPILATILGIAVAIIPGLWEKILEFANHSLFPWIEKNYPPHIAMAVRLAFAVADKGIVPIRQAWKQLRQYLLKTVTEFQKKSSNKWVKRATSFIIKLLGSQSGNDKQPIAKVVTEETIDPDFLPPDVREAWLRRSRTNYEIDVSDLRDRELGDMDVSY